MVSNLQFQTLHYNQPQHPANRLLGGSKAIVTCRFPKAGHMSLASSLPSGKFGPRVANSVSTL
jgi:hypothetical protein